jgi:hypothetical protein
MKQDVSLRPRAGGLPQSVSSELRGEFLYLAQEEVGAP